MSEINFFSRTSGSGGTAVVRALDVRAVNKSARSSTQHDKTREERVAELKQQYEDGQYVVNSKQLSSALVQELLNRRR